MMKYRRKIVKYKYELTERFYYVFKRSRGLPHVNREPYILLNDYRISIGPGYAWDGPSGPTIDTQNFMRGSLVHDAFYQLMRQGHLPQDFRDTADRILRDICLEDGMSRIRSWWVYTALKHFGGRSARLNDGL